MFASIMPVICAAEDEDDSDQEDDIYDQQSSTPDVDGIDELPVVPMPQFSKESRALLKGVLKDCVELRNAINSGYESLLWPMLRHSSWGMFMTVRCPVIRDAMTSLSC